VKHRQATLPSQGHPRRQAFASQPKTDHYQHSEPALSD
jgi:hypothetical protein